MILDELTPGLDPEARRGIWELIEQIRGDGVTVVLVSHSMDEVERLCDRIAIRDRGRIVVIGLVAFFAMGASQDSSAPRRTCRTCSPTSAR